jgi:alanine racemase
VRRGENVAVIRSQFTLDLTAVRANVRRLRDVAGGAEVWAVVKADGYGHGAVDVASAAVGAGAAALCVATVAEALVLRAALPEQRLIVLGPADEHEVAAARAGSLELVVSTSFVPEGVPVHVKLDTGMGRWGLSELTGSGRDIVGLMTHFASADSDREFTEAQLQRFLDATAGHPGPARHAANSAATLALPESRLDAVRCGIAVYGISPFGDDPAAHGLVPALRWSSRVAQAKLLGPGETTGYGRRFVAATPTWIALVPVGYADGFRRDLTGTEVLVDGVRCPVVGTVSMDVIAVATPGPAALGTEVTLLGDGVLIEDHARVAGTIAYEVACGLNMRAPRAERRVVDA